MLARDHYNQSKTACALVVALLTATLGGCGTREDYSTPKAAVRTLFVAMATGDMSTAKAALADPAQADLLNDVKGLIEGIAAVQDAAVQRFGENGKTVRGAPSLDEIDRADETIDGDRAVLQCDKARIRRLALRRIDGQWKVDLLATLSITSGGAKQMVQSVRKIIADHTERIRSGQYQSPQEAERVLETSINLSVMSRVLIGT